MHAFIKEVYDSRFIYLPPTLCTSSVKYLSAFPLLHKPNRMAGLFHYLFPIHCDQKNPSEERQLLEKSLINRSCCD
jgi:hypothetical protein